MPLKKEWEEKITETTLHRKWTLKNAEDFLSFLRERIGNQATLKAMKTVSFFEVTNYETFILRFDIFSEHVNKERVAEQLKACLTCFTKGPPRVIRNVIEIIKEYFGQEDEAIVTEALNNNVIVFSLSENQSKVLRELLHFLESYIGKEGVKDIILNKPSSFSIFRIKTQKKSNGVKIYILQLPLVVKYLESYIERESVQDINAK